MKRDFHFDTVRLLGAWAGLDSEISTLVAWASEKTDRITKPLTGCIQTQVPIEIDGNWKDRQVQLTVEAAFHFIPGDGEPWMVTPNSKRAQAIVQMAMNDPIRLGIALHTLADTWAHQGFSGFIESRNSCFAWSNLFASMVPNLGHSDMLEVPDMVEAVWVDPRTGDRIVNRHRFREAAMEIWRLLTRFAHTDWVRQEIVIREIFDIPNYADRRRRLYQEWLNLGNNGFERWKYIDEQHEKYMADFDRAAKEQVSLVLDLCKDLPAIR